MSRKIGDQAEQQALCFLQKQGFKLVQRNFSTKLGEIDLIGFLHDALLFVEVKQRASGCFGSALEMVTIKNNSVLEKQRWFFCSNIRSISMPIADLMLLPLQTVSLSGFRMRFEC